MSRLILILCAGFVLLRLFLAGVVVAFLFAIGGCAVAVNKPAGPSAAAPHYLDDLLARRIGVPHE
mgnify:CR=1 FL=1